MDKKEVQQNIDSKNKEIADLKAKILAENEEIKKKEFEEQQKKLENELVILQQKLEELKILEENTTTDQTTKETQKLKDNVEINSDWTYELMKGSTMYDKLTEIGKSDIEIKEFAENIDKVVRKYLDQELEGFPNSIKNSMSVGIQFAMMETLIKQGADGSVQFFEAFADTKSKSATKAFEGLYKAFGMLGSANEFFILANKVQNITWYLDDKKNIITDSQNIPELMNPVQFKTLLSNPVWSNQAQIDKLDITTILTLNSSTAVDIHAGEDELKKIVNDPAIAGVITKETISAIEKSLKTADKLLDKREQFQDKATDLIDKIAGILDINIPFLGNLGELIGMKFPTDILGEKKDGGVLNFVLGVLGFRGGLKGLHRKYIQEKLDSMDIDNDFIAVAYTAFQKNIDTTITNDSDISTWKVCSLVASDTTTEAAIKAKIPADYTGLKKSIVDNLSTAKLNPTVVAKFAPAAIITENDTSTVDVTKITDANIDIYLKDIIPKLIADDFITSDKVDKDSFALAVIGGLVGDKYFIEGVNIGLLATTDFKLNIPTSSPSTSTPSPSYENIDETDDELTRLAAGPNENYTENQKFKQYLHTLEGKNSLPYGIIFNLMKTESGGKLYKADGVTIIGSTAGAKGLFQFMPDTAKIYIKKIGYTEDNYEKIFTNPIIGAKACAQFLKDRKDAGDDTVNMLAHYNAGSNILSGKKITKKILYQLPKETQKYATKIGYDMLEYSGKSTVITLAQKEDPSLINEATLDQFLTAVNSIPPTKETTATPEVASEVKIEAKTLAELSVLGDSHAGGLARWLPKNVLVQSVDANKKNKYYDGFSSGELLDVVKQRREEIKLSSSLLLVVGANDISKNTVSTLAVNLKSIQEEIIPTQLVLSTLQYYPTDGDVPRAKVDEVNTIIRNFAKENGLPLIDVNTLTFSNTDYQPDKRHLLKSGYLRIAKYVAKQVTGSENLA